MTESTPLAPEPPPETLRVLIVEDIPQVAQTFATLVRDAFAPRTRCEIAVAGSLIDARPLLVIPQFDVVLLDLNLPDSQGLGTVVRFREISVYPVPFVVLSGIPASEDEQVAAMILGASGFLVKSEVAGEMRWLRRAIRFGMARTRYVNDLVEKSARALAEGFARMARDASD